MPPDGSWCGSELYRRNMFQPETSHLHVLLCTYHLLLPFFEKRKKLCCLQQQLTSLQFLPVLSNLYNLHSRPLLLSSPQAQQGLFQSPFPIYSYGCAFSRPALYVHSIAVHLWNNLSRSSDPCFGKVSDCGHLLFVHNWFPKEMNSFLFRNLYVCFIPVYFEFFYTFYYTIWIIQCKLTCLESLPRNIIKITDFHGNCNNNHIYGHNISKFEIHIHFLDFIL